MSAKAGAKRERTTSEARETRDKAARNRRARTAREQKETASNRERTAKDETILDLEDMDISADLERYLDGVEDELKDLLESLGGGDAE